MNVRTHVTPFPGLVAPNVKVKEWQVGAFNGSSARLECLVESYPAALTYWENRQGRLLEDTPQHRVYNVPDANVVWRVSGVGKKGEDWGEWMEGGVGRWAGGYRILMTNPDNLFTLCLNN